ncbi:MAG TPA: nucleotidyl transferase AbiEii/AbiGii toxin family protein [Pyrinomonadaceae bacterium]|nr:nucleotidyl transferase AbiEii/AbiGii toxin family protein [Pyrinomonadaceae bacterium]
MSEPLPLATIQQAILEFLKGRDDVVVFGATAVNAYVGEARMTEDIDLISSRAAELAEELCQHLGQRFHIAIRVRVVGGGKGYRVFQIKSSGNRHLIDLRPAASLPKAQRIEDILVMTPEELIARKVISYRARRGQPKSGTDWRDLALLLLTFPELKSETGPVAESLHGLGATKEVLNTWRELVALEFSLPSEEDEFT